MFTKKLAVAAAMICACSHALADSAAIEWAGNPQYVYSNGPYMMGYEFAVSTTQQASALGAFDDQGDGFITGSHQVGLWTLSGTLLATTTVSSSDALQGHFRYAAISGVTLNAGEHYIVAADNWGGGGDNWAWRETGGMNLISAPGITHVQDKYAAGSGFMFAGTSEGTLRDGFYGANLRVSAVPEPATYGMLGLGLGLIALFARRKATRSNAS